MIKLIGGQLSRLGVLLVPAIYYCFIAFFLISILYLTLGDLGISFGLAIVLCIVFLTSFYGDKIILTYVNARPILCNKGSQDARSVVENLAFEFNLPAPQIYFFTSIGPNVYGIRSFGPQTGGAIMIDESFMSFDRSLLKAMMAHTMLRVDCFESKVSTAVVALIILLKLPIIFLEKLMRRLPYTRPLSSFFFLTYGAITKAIENIATNMAISTRQLKRVDQNISDMVGLAPLEAAIMKVEAHKVVGRKVMTALLPLAFCDNIGAGSNFYFFNRFPTISKRLESIS
jgi:hypothetical protein